MGGFMIQHEGIYLPRIIDSVVEQHLQAFGAIEITGTMWSGKTWTSLEHGESECNLDDPEIRNLAELSPDTILSGKTPQVIDEWQLVPSIWDVLRRRVDTAAGKRGLYILTGSSRPSKNSTTHSGSGRISRLKMWPMSLQESKDSDGTVSLSDLFDNKFLPSEYALKPIELAKLICRGGWPAALNLDPSLSGLVATQYIDSLISSQDINAPESENDLRLFLQSLARNIGSAPKIDTLTKDMNYIRAAQVTETGRRRIRNLIAYFTNRFVVDELRGWEAPIKSPQRLRSKPRYDFADPSIPAALLGVDEVSLLNNTQLFGQLFEQMCLRDLRIYTSALNKAKPDSLHYYRDSDGLEVDAIIELRDGQWAGIEIKLNSNKVQDAETSLLRLRDKVASNPSARNPQPTFLMVLTGIGKYSYRLPSGVYVVPITKLGA